MKTFSRRLLSFAILLFSATASLGQLGNVKFWVSSVVAHQQDGSVSIGVTGTGQSVATTCTVFAHSTNSTRAPGPSTAVIFVDYTTNSVWKQGGIAENAGHASVTGIFNNTVFFSIPLLVNTNLTAPRTIVLGFWSATGPQFPTNCIVTILPDPIVSITATKPRGSETGPTVAEFTVTREGDTSYDVIVNFSRSGTATHGGANDYTLTGSQVQSSTSVLIPAGSSSAIINVSPVNDTSPEPEETVILKLTSGYFKTNSQNTATAYITDNDPEVSITATDQNASESGDSALFTVTRTSDPSLPLTVFYSVGGTAINGTDYAFLPGAVTIPAGESYATITVAPAGNIIEGLSTVEIDLIATNTYTLGVSDSAFVYLTAYEDNARPLPTTSWQLGATARTGRFVRGTGSNPANHSFVVPVDLDKGVPLDDTGGNALNLFPSIPWNTTLFHLNAINPLSRISFQNPIVAFGSRVGGSPLYFDRPYTFGIYAGNPMPTSYGTTNQFATALRIQVYQKSNMASVGTIAIPIPDGRFTNEWNAFLTNGYTKTVTGFGLTTTLTFNQPNQILWGADPAVGPNDVAYHVLHTATPDAENYVYMLELAGGVGSGWMVIDGGSARSWSRLYTLEFESRPPWRTVLLDRPAFEGAPLPPAYFGTSAEELATNAAFVTNIVNLPLSPTNYLGLDLSPELRRHPILDQFVTNMARDPILLANYVFNEIELTDTVDYSDSGALSEIAVNPGGVSRGAAATFLEGQGSPTEQCALLIYLLRQAGIPAVYQFAPHNGLQMLDSRLSTLLKMQIRGAVKSDGTQYTTNRLIPVNYPWVAAYVSNNWVHIFPWLKDTEVIEGFDLHDFLPTSHNTPFKWARDYIFASSNLLSLSLEDDTPLVLYPKWLQKTLNESSPGMAFDDFGIRFRNRRHYRTRWSDFPTPTYVTNQSVSVDVLGSWAITNVSPFFTNLFDTVSVEVKSLVNTNIKVSSGDLRLAELHNRRFLVRHEKVSVTSHRLVLTLAAFRTNITTVRDFSTVTQVFPPNTNALNFLRASNTLGSTDDLLQVTIVHRKHRSLGTGFSQPDPSSVYLGYHSFLSVTNIRSINKGDLAAICLNMGRVTKAMLGVHADEIWRLEQRIEQTASTTNSVSPDLYQGTVAYLMGMSYFEKNDRFRQLVAPLHKANIIRYHGSGLAGLVAKRDATNGLPNGDVILVQPKVDMYYQELGIVDGRTFHAEAGDGSYNQADRFSELFITAGSAQEHSILNSFFKQSDAVSTVKLLHLAQQYNTNGILALNRYNYFTNGNKVFAGSTNKLKDLDPSMWAVISNSFNSAYISNNVQAFVTPGKIRNLTGSFDGLGALIFRPASYAALISPNLNGGFAETLEDNALTAGNLDKTKLSLNKNGDYEYSTSRPSSNKPELLSPTDPAWNMPRTKSDISDGALELNPVQTTTFDIFKSLNGLTSSQRNVQFEEMGEDGVVIPQKKPSFLEKIADPVNAIFGDFYVDEIDLILPGPMPLHLRRNYSSHNVFDGDLGYGWKFSYFPYLAVNSAGTVINCSEVDGSVVTYRQTSTNANVYLPDVKDNPRLQDVAGSVANLFNARITKGATTYTNHAPDGSRRVYRVQSFAIADLTRSRPYLESWTDSRGNFLKFYYGGDLYDTDFGRINRIEANNGNFVFLNYDIYGHVIEILTGDGRRITYDYDIYGDLVRVTLPDAAEIKYEYEHRNYVTADLTDFYSTHLLTREIKPEGRILENKYDAQRRVVEQSATVGYDLRLVRNASFAYSNNFNIGNYWTNFITGYTLVTDYRTNVTRYDYTNSLLRKITDPLNRVTVQDWYATNDASPGAYKNALKKIVDARGLVTTRLYDLVGNVTNVTVTGDLTGSGNTNETAVTSMEYNANRLVTRVIDPVGNQTLYTYTNASFPFLQTSEERYASNGTPISTTVFTYSSVTQAPPPNLTNFLGSYGLLQREVRAFGTSDAATNDWTSNVQGFHTQHIRYTSTGDPYVTRFPSYNLRGELVESTDAAGRTTRFTYDGRGRLQSREVFDEAGRRVSTEFSYYNENGEPIWNDGARFDPEDYVWCDYDGAGRKIQEVRWRSQAKANGTGVEAASGDSLFATSFFEFDPFSNLIKAIDPRGHYQRMSYDAVGQLKEQRSYDAQTGELLASRGFAYEPGGKIAFETNALGGVTETQYTTNGLPKFRRNADGSTNAWRYYLDGRVHREIQGNGAYWENVYDDANRKVTRSFYTSAGSLLATNLSIFDRRGNVIQKTDPVGSTFTNFFDGLDRLKWMSGPTIVSTNPPGVPAPPGPPAPPIRQASTNFYDAAGIALTNVNAVGEKTITLFDALGRVTRVESRDTNNAVIRETATAYALNHHSVTTTNGAGATAIVSTMFSDNSGQPILAIGYPSASTREFTLSRYDMAGNLESHSRLSDTSGTITLWQTNFYSHDGLNRLRTASERDNAVTTFNYDASGNLTNRTMPGGLQWQARYNNANLLLEEKNVGFGGVATRTNTYTYFGSGLLAGLLQTRSDERGVVCTYIYDDWLRVVTNVHAGPLPEHNLTNSWTYDPRGLLTLFTESFASNSVGPSKTIQWNYDAYRQIKQESVSAGSFNSLAIQSWDSVGRRTGVGFGSFGFGFGWRADGLVSSVAGPTGGGIYNYDTAGVLTSRSHGSRLNTITSRDGVGRPLSATTTVNSLTRLAETLTWTGDGLLATHTIERNASGQFTNSQAYFYANSSRRLIEERLNLDSAKRWTNTFVYDQGAASGPGVLTKAGAPVSGLSDWTGGADAFSRISVETNSATRRLAHGRVNGPATISALLDGVAQSVTVVGTTDAAWTNQWRSQMELTPGAHQLVVSARHPSGQFTTNTSIWFTNNVTGHTASDAYDAMGNVISRVWKNPNGTTNRTQALSWDARGRLHKVIERDSSNSGFDWSAVYDPLGRRLQTTTLMVTNGITLTGQPKVISSYYDPLVEFLELGVTVDGKTTWKLYGPDLNGVYGGLNGTGGFDAIVPGPELFCPTLADSRGNVHGVYDQTHATLAWNPSRPTGYGAAPGYRPAPLGHGASAVAAASWRGRWTDITGLTWLGARYYNSESGTFISGDPVWNGGDPNYYTFAGGDPINGFDPDGRLMKKLTRELGEFELEQTMENSAFRGRIMASTADSLYNIPLDILHDAMLRPPPDMVVIPDGYFDGPKEVAKNLEAERNPLMRAGWYEPNSPEYFFGAIYANLGVVALAETLPQQMPHFVRPNASTIAIWDDLLLQVEARMNAAKMEGGGFEFLGMSKRDDYMGSTPGKYSPVGEQVMIRMAEEGKLRVSAGQVEVLNSQQQWVPLEATDMSHLKDAVKAWNEGLYQTGPKSPEVRQFMNNPNNYELDSSSINRSKGARLRETYRDPEKPNQ